MTYEYSPMPVSERRLIDSARQPLARELAEYAARWPHESGTGSFLGWLETETQPFHRETQAGHFTGSAWLVSNDGQRVLLMLHRKLGRWLQPGGHADGDPDLANVALREAEEETGLTDLAVRPGIFDIDAHEIPARQHEPRHWHYDVRYVVVAQGSELVTMNEESLDLAWRSIVDIAGDPGADESLRRMAAKWLARPASATI